VLVHGWEVRAWRGDELDVVVTCSGGTYVRALARDLGERSGSAAHLVALRRSSSGPFDVRDAAVWDDVAAGEVNVLPPVAAVRSLPAEQLDEERLAMVLHGRPVAASLPGERAALLDANGALVAVATRAAGDGMELWQPRLVLRDAS
jgi:tRNA pseudouridine55 synthase